MVRAFFKTIPVREYIKSARMRYISSDETGDEKPNDLKDLVENGEEVE